MEFRFFVGRNHFRTSAAHCWPAAFNGELLFRARREPPIVRPWNSSNVFQLTRPSQASNGLRNSIVSASTALLPLGRFPSCTVRSRHVEPIKSSCETRFLYVSRREKASEKAELENWELNEMQTLRQRLDYNSGWNNGRREDTKLCDSHSLEAWGEYHIAWQSSFENQRNQRDYQEPIVQWNRSMKSPLFVTSGTSDFPSLFSLRRETR